MKPARRVMAAAIILGLSAPAFSQTNMLDIHLNQQLQNRLQDHQNTQRRMPPRRDGGNVRSRDGRDMAPDQAVIRRLKTHFRTLERRIPQGRRIEVAKDGRVFIHVQGRVDEPAVTTFAERLLQTKVILKSFP